jgi:hypothetical protein
MTLIAMWRRSDHVLVACDTLATSSAGASATEPKVWQIGDAPLMWGYSGPTTYAEPIHPRMKDPLPETWEELLDIVGGWVGAATSLIRFHTRQAGRSEPPPGELLHVMVGGVWDGRAEMIEIEPSGQRGFSSTDEGFLGSAAPYASFANTTAQRLAGTDEERLHVVMESTVRWRPIASTVGEPILYWRITAEGIEELK